MSATSLLNLKHLLKSYCYRGGMQQPAWIIWHLSPRLRQTRRKTPALITPQERRGQVYSQRCLQLTFRWSFLRDPDHHPRLASQDLHLQSNSMTPPSTGERIHRKDLWVHYTILAVLLQKFWYCGPLPWFISKVFILWAVVLIWIKIRQELFCGRNCF